MQNKSFTFEVGRYLPLQLLYMKRIKYLECIVLEHPKNNALCIEIRVQIIIQSN